MASFPGELHTP